MYDFPVPSDAGLRAAGVNVAVRHDGIRDLWGPYGTGDMLDRAMHLAYRNTFRRDDDIELALDAVTRRARPRSACRRTGWSWARRPTWWRCGRDRPAEAVVTRPTRDLVLKAGRVTSSTLCEVAQPRELPPLGVEVGRVEPLLVRGLDRRPLGVGDREPVGVAVAALGDHVVAEPCPRR